MKITGGELKGITLKTPRGIRPAQNMVRKAIFDTIGDVRDKDILDIFAGSGSLGFEAISRGARRCTFVEKDIKCVKIIEENAKKLSVIDRVKILKMSFKKFLDINTEKFDIIFTDPPYRIILQDEEIKNILKILKKRGILIMETQKKLKFGEELEKFILKEVFYGQTKITYFTCRLSGKL
jgi:16S rRNA (guanine(966)-N(2))-methyltransferase RsmD